MFLATFKSAISDLVNFLSFFTFVFPPVIFALVIVSGLVGVVRELTHDYLPRNDHASDTPGVSVSRLNIFIYSLTPSLTGVSQSNNVKLTPLTPLSVSQKVQQLTLTPYLSVSQITR